MRVVSIMLFCFGLVACAGQGSLEQKRSVERKAQERERAAEAKAQKALLAPQEFYDLNRARKLEIEKNVYKQQSV